VVVRGYVDRVPDEATDAINSGSASFGRIKNAMFKLYTLVRVDGTPRLVTVDIGAAKDQADAWSVAVTDRSWPKGSDVFDGYAAILEDWQDRQNNARMAGWLNASPMVITGYASGRTACVNPSYFPLFEVYDQILTSLRKLECSNPYMVVLTKRFIGFIEACKQPYRQIASAA
jgi:hypothetical protein